MGFPDDAELGTKVEANLGGVWTDITPDTRLGQLITVVRGRSDWAARVDPSKVTVQIRNPDGKYSPRNPVGPYYGKFGRNTPLRVSVAPSSTPWLDCPHGAPNTASTPDANILDIVGDLDVRVDAELAVWGSATGDPAGTTELMGKYNTTANQRSWRLLVVSTTCLELTWSTNGTNFIAADSAPLDVAPGARLSVRATLDVDNGAGGFTVTFYTSTTPGTAGPWTQLGSPVTGAGTTSVFSGTAPLNVGHIPTLIFGNMARKIYKAEVRNGINGTVVANPNFTAQTVGATSFLDTAPSVRTWTVTAGAISNRDVRGIGEVPSWPPRWGPSGRLVTVDLEAAGIQRRLGQGATPLASTLRRRLPSDPSLIAYWPMEEAGNATQAYSPLPGVIPLATKLMQFASVDSLVGSAPLPTVQAGTTLRGTVPTATGLGWQVEMVFNLPQLPTSQQQIFTVNVQGATLAQAVVSAAPTGIRIEGFDSSGTSLGTITNTSAGAIADFVGVWNRLIITVADDGGGVTRLSALWPNIVTGVYWFAATAFTSGMGRVSSVSGVWSSLADGMALGHIAVFGKPSTTSGGLPVVGTGIFDGADSGFAGETVASRMRRLATEEALPVSLAAPAAGDEQMGAQGQDTLLNLLQGAADTDTGGVLFEPRDELGLRFRSRATLYNQPVRLALDYAQQQVGVPLEPEDDDQATRNDVTVTRSGGSSARATLDSGPLSTQAPPSGVGRYTDSVTLNLADDDQPEQHAGWRLHMGTYDGIRYPAVTISLHRCPELIPAASSVDIGDRIQILNPPPWLPPGPIDLIVQGSTEVIGIRTWTMTFNCTPAGPWTVAIADDPVLARADTEGSALSASATSTGGAISVATTSGPLWTTDAASWPFDLAVGGERMTVTAVGLVLNPNSGFEQGTAGWTAFSGTLVQSTAQVHSGSFSGLLTTSASSDPRCESGQVAVTVGATYRATGWLFTPDVLPMQPGVNVNWFTSGGVYLSTSVDSKVLPANGWLLFDAVFTAPATAAFATVTFGIGGTPGTGLRLFADRVTIIPTTSYLTSPQTMTVDRSANGVVKAQASGTAVRLATPSIVAL